MAKIRRIHTNHRKGDIWNLLVGILLVIIGIYVWLNPSTALMVLSLYFGIIFAATAVGYFSAYRAWGVKSFILLAALSAVLGFLFVMNIGIADTTIPMLFGFWVLSVGIYKTLSALQFKKADMPFWTLPFTSGAISIVFGLLILFYPAAGAFAITIVMGTYLALSGALAIGEFFLVKQR